MSVPKVGNKPWMISLFCDMDGGGGGGGGVLSNLLDLDNNFAVPPLS